MSTLDEIKKMQSKGMQESEIISTMQQKGIPYKDISDALSQSKIKAAVEQPAIDPNLTPPQNQNLENPSQNPNASYIAQNAQDIQGMQPSIMQSPHSQNPVDSGNQSMQPPQQPQTQDYQQMQPQNYAENEYYPEQYSYDYSSTSMSPDTITEISEQIVSEKLSEVRKKIENIIDFKTSFEAKSEALDDRLKRIEKIIDTLQSSVLRKVGDYGTNISDIKKELIETQKSFKKISKKKTSRSKKKK
tara:strand:+ start:2682 stop:3416 length:735 start_codon:yes stop_codon:yes gene_type:complete